MVHSAYAQALTHVTVTCMTTQARRTDSASYVAMGIVATLPLVFGIAMHRYHTAAPSPAPVPAVSAPTSLPACLQEDGAGMALCTWDARRQGNGPERIAQGRWPGRAVISGDCARDAITADDAVSLCVRLHAQTAYDVVYQGTTVHVPAGPDLIDGCVADARTPGHATVSRCIATWTAR